MVLITTIMWILDIWGLDENGFFKSGDENNNSIVSRICALLPEILQRHRAHSTGTASNNSGSVAQRVLCDLKNIHKSLKTELTTATDSSSGSSSSGSSCSGGISNQDKGKRLLFLFQRDLLPGISGKILESKGQRDNITIIPVSYTIQYTAWIFMFILNISMLFYILLFAVSQTKHKQTAWALSFILWLVVEILLVSSSMVLITHILLPMLIISDVNKIKLKLANSIKEFNTGIRNKHNTQNIVTNTQTFNAANYLFISTRLASEWSNIKEAQIILQFSTPWPKQSYQHEANVSKSYNKKYSAIIRSGSIIAIFFLTQLLQIPPSLQDIIVNMLSTIIIGYTIFIHIELFSIFPILIIVPVVIISIILHFIIKSNAANAKLRHAKMFPISTYKLNTTTIQNSNNNDSNSSITDDVSSKLALITPIFNSTDVYNKKQHEEGYYSSDSSSVEEGKHTEQEQEQQEELILARALQNLDTAGIQDGDFHLPVCSTAGGGSGSGGSSSGVHAKGSKHVTRRQSVQQGLRVLQTLQEQSQTAVPQTELDINTNTHHTVDEFEKDNNNNTDAIHSSSDESESTNNSDVEVCSTPAAGVRGARPFSAMSVLALTQPGRHRFESSDLDQASSGNSSDGSGSSNSSTQVYNSHMWMSQPSTVVKPLSNSQYHLSDSEESGSCEEGDGMDLQYHSVASLTPSEEQAYIHAFSQKHHTTNAADAALDAEVSLTLSEQNAYNSLYYRTQAYQDDWFQQQQEQEGEDSEYSHSDYSQQQQEVDESGSWEHSDDESGSWEQGDIELDPQTE